MFAVLCMVSLFTVLFASDVRANEPMTATDFALNGDYSVDTMLMTDTQEDWYRLTIPADGKFEVKIMSYCSGNLSFALFNEDLSQQYKFSNCDDYVSGGTETSPVTGTATKVLSQGVYYFRLSGTTGRYRMCGSFAAYGVNDSGIDSYDAPFEYSLGTKITGALTQTDTEDWYRITVPKNGYYTLKLMSYTGDYLYYTFSNQDLSTTIDKGYVSGGSESSPQTLSKELTLVKGTYYIRLYDAKGKYVFQFSEKASTAKKNTSKTIKKLSVVAKKGKKTFTVSTIANATVTVKYSGQTWSKLNSGKSGKIKITSVSKLKKGAKIKVIVKKKGYKTVTKYFKVK